MAENNQEQPNFEIDFGEAEGVEPYEPEDKPVRAVMRPLNEDGYYLGKITEATRRLSKRGNGVLSLRIELQEQDTIGTAVYTDITVTGKSDKESKRPNIYSLVPVLLSTGRTWEDIQARISGKDKMSAEALARSLTTDGKNICYVQIRHEIQTFGKNAGKERPTVANFVTKDFFTKRQDKKATRWPKKLGNEAVTNAGSNGTMSMPDVDMNTVVEGLLG